MKQDQYDKMIEALESGGFRQHYSALCSGLTVGKSERHCCIGVGVAVNGGGHIGSTGEAALFLGLTNKAKDNLVWMNDADQRDFFGIAAYMRENPGEFLDPA